MLTDAQKVTQALLECGYKRDGSTARTYGFGPGVTTHRPRYKLPGTPHRATVGDKTTCIYQLRNGQAPKYKSYNTSKVIEIIAAIRATKGEQMKTGLEIETITNLLTQINKSACVNGGYSIMFDSKDDGHKLAKILGNLESAISVNQGTEEISKACLDVMADGPANALEAVWSQRCLYLLCKIGDLLKKEPDGR